jgi:Xaa-Pro aminopeptidase
VGGFVSGSFSKPQRDVYEALLEVQEECVRLCRPDGLTLNEIYVEMLNLLGRQLVRLGIVRGNKSTAELHNV